MEQSNLGPYCFACKLKFVVKVKNSVDIVSRGRIQLQFRLSFKSKY